MSLVIRAPNHLGDFVMALPALYSAKPDAVIVPDWLDPLARFAGFATIPFNSGNRGFVSAAASLRRGQFDRGILLAPSFSAALMLRLGGVKSRRGTNTDRRGLLLTSIVDRSLLKREHRATAYYMMACGDPPSDRPVPSLPVSRETRSAFRQLVGTTAPIIGICPGSNAPSRTWPQERFAAVVRALSATVRVVVFGSTSERERTSSVAGNFAIDLGGETNLPALAAGLAECGVVISNDSGPLHLAAAVGTPTISMWGAGDPARTGPPPGAIILRDPRLPCLECVKNECPRRGSGYILDRAHMECLQLVDAGQVIAAARELLRARSPQ